MASADMAQDGVGYEILEGEPPELLGRNLVSAGHLLAGATAFFFVSFVFAFFYLRSIDTAVSWKPPGVDASIGWGIAIVACWVISAALTWLGLGDHVAMRRDQWRLKGVVALLFGVAGLVLQGLAWGQQGFGPTDGAFASVYVGWTGFLFVFVLGTLLWLEMTVATSYRYRKTTEGVPPPGHASGDPHREAHDIKDPLSLVRAELHALSFYWMFLAGIAVLTWIVLYLVS